MREIDGILIFTVAENNANTQVYLILSVWRKMFCFVYSLSVCVYVF